MLGKRMCTRGIYHAGQSRLYRAGPLDPYRLLGVKRDATDSEIKEAYLKKCKELHPDVNKGPKAAQEFMEVREAYSALRPENRKKFEFGEDVGKRSGMDDAFKQAMGRENQSWEATFDKFSGAQEKKRRMMQDRYNSYSKVHGDSFGNKVNMENFEDWEKQHFEKLGARNMYNLRGQMKEKSPEELRTIRRHILLLLSAAVLLVSVEIVKGLN